MDEVMRDTEVYVEMMDSIYNFLNGLWTWNWVQRVRSRFTFSRAYLGSFLLLPWPTLPLCGDGSNRFPF